jgi:hypothetical protein
VGGGRGAIVSFEIIVQIRQAAIESILRAQHRHGVMNHTRTISSGTGVAQVILGAPRLRLLPSAGAMSEILAMLDFRTILSRFGAGSAEVATSEVIGVSVHTSTQFETGQNPTSYQSGLKLLLGWHADASDVTGPSGIEPSAGAISAILEAMPEWHDTFPIPELSSVSPSLHGCTRRGVAVGDAVTLIAHRVLTETVDSEPVLAVGINLTGFEPGSLADLSSRWVTHDWAVVLSSDFVLSSVECALQDFLGGLPPPNGARAISFRENPDVTLDRLAFHFAGGGIHFDGHFSVPHANADFSFDMMVRLQGDAIALELENFSIENIHHDLIGFVVNLFRDFDGEIRRGLTSVLQANVGGSLGGFFSQNLLSRFASGGPLERVHLSPLLASLAVVPEGLLIHGLLSIPDQTADPVVQFSLTELGSVRSTSTRTDFGTAAPREHLQLGSSPSDTFARSARTAFHSLTPGGGSLPSLRAGEISQGLAASVRDRSAQLPLAVGGDTNQGSVLHPSELRWLVLLDGSTCWSPGGDCVGYQWIFGDGDSETSFGPAARAVTRHAFRAGFQAVTLRVWNAAGHVATASQQITLGAVRLRHLVQDSAIAWVVCTTDNPLSLRFLVDHAGEPVPSARVVVRGDGWSRLAVTDGDGIAAFEPIDLSRLHALPGEGRVQEHVAGRLHVDASRTGYMDALQQHVVIYDCRTELAPDHVDALRERLVDIFRGWGRGLPGSPGPAPAEAFGLSGLTQLDLSRAVEIVAELGVLANGSSLTTRQSNASSFVAAKIAPSVPGAAQFAIRESIASDLGRARSENQARDLLAEMGLAFMISPMRDGGPSVA